MWVTPRSRARWIVAMDSASSRSPPEVYVPAIVIAPRPIRDTSRAPRCALRMSAPAVWVGRAVASTLSRPSGGRQPLSRGGTGSDSVRYGGGSSLGCMVDKDGARAALRAFLVTRRARVSPAEAGLAVIGSRRRVPGLRREEGAMLAGISVEYYVRLERGQATGPSPGVVDGVAQALRLSDDERVHLDRLLAELTPEVRKRRRRPVTETVSDGVQVVLDAMTTLPAVVQNARLDVVAANALGRLLYAPVFDLEGAPNSARFLFLDEIRARRLFPHWERIADDTVALLRIEAGRHPEDRAMVELVGQLSTCSAAFRTRWARNDVRAHNAGVKVFAHPVVGELALPYENLLIDAAADHTLTVFTPRPGSPEHDAVQLLASWHAASRSDAVQPRQR